MEQSQIVFFYVHRQSMVPGHCPKYEENPPIHHEGMYEDRQPDGQMDRESGFIPIFSDFLIAEQQIIK